MSNIPSAFHLMLALALCAVSWGVHSQDGLIRPNADPIKGAERECQAASLNRSKLAEAIDWIETNDSQLHSFLVYQCGRKIVEDYYLGYDAIMPHDLQSATKTVTSMLIGAALKSGLLKDLDQPLVELLPEYRQLMIGAKAAITLRHVLTMTTGLRWKDFGRGNSFDAIASAEDSVEYVLSEPLVSLPGEVFFYNTGSSHILSAIITKVTGKSALDYADEVLFSPLGMMDYRWDNFADGRNLGGWGLYMRPRDMAKLGQVLADQGRWLGRQIVDAGFVAWAMTAQTATQGGPGGSGYGFQMWIQDDITKKPSAAAIGWGGQAIFILAELDAVVVFTGSVDINPARNFEDIRYVLKQFVVGPAVGQLDRADGSAGLSRTISAGRFSTR